MENKLIKINASYIFKWMFVIIGCIMFLSFKSYSATLSDFSACNYQSKLHDYTVQQINNWISNVPSNVVTSFNNHGGIIQYADHCAYRKKGMYVMGTFTRPQNVIEVSTENISIIGFTTCHELGHYVYFHTISMWTPEIQLAIGKYIGSGNGIKQQEGFADLYAYRGIGLTEPELVKVMESIEALVND